MAINYGANYIGVDKDRYDAGNQFYSQDRFLQGTGLDKPAITLNPLISLYLLIEFNYYGKL